MFSEDNMRENIPNMPINFWTKKLAIIVFERYILNSESIRMYDVATQFDRTQWELDGAMGRVRIVNADGKPYIIVFHPSGDDQYFKSYLTLEEYMVLEAKFLGDFKMNKEYFSGIKNFFRNITNKWKK